MPDYRQSPIDMGDSGVPDALPGCGDHRKAGTTHDTRLLVVPPQVADDPDRSGERLESGPEDDRRKPGGACRRPLRTDLSGRHSKVGLRAYRVQARGGVALYKARPGGSAGGFEFGPVLGS